jgi:hypothetical protein
VVRTKVEGCEVSTGSEAGDGEEVAAGKVEGQVEGEGRRIKLKGQFSTLACCSRWEVFFCWRLIYITEKKKGRGPH